MANNTIFSVYNETKEKLAAAGIEDYGFEARVIMRQVTGFDNRRIIENYNLELNAYQRDRLDGMVSRRTARYPLQYILGEWEFYGRPFKVGEGVLIPRADTETVVETALCLIKNTPSPKVLDLCAGSGAIGITVAAERPDSKVTLLEKYDAAAGYLKENVLLNKTENAVYVKGDVLAADGTDKKYDLIVSNPPYLCAADMEALQPEVKYEPSGALFGGSDGLDFYRAIIKNYSSAIKSGGAICFEAGAGEAEKIEEFLITAGFSGVTRVPDLSGIDRVVFGTVK